jgi:nitroreductase
MELSEVIERRRAYRSLESLEITRKTIDSLASAAGLSASCYNNQPWRFVFVFDSEPLGRLKDSLSRGNEWARSASMIIAVCGKREDDCALKDGRAYYQFDIGMATALLILRATELGLVAHPIAGYDPKKAGEAVGLPDGYEAMALLVVGKRSKKMNPILSEKQIEAEAKRPERNGLESFAFFNRFGAR